METGRNCAYNVTRNTLLSECVTVVCDHLDPKQLLAVVLGGPGRDPQSSVWLRCVPVALGLPRLFAFDIAYVGEDQRVLEAADVGPGTDFPPLSEGVAGVLILPDRRLAETGTVAGDVVRLCGESELAVLLKVASHPYMEPGEAPPQAGSGQISPALPISPVTRLSESALEPFAGSLVYLPQPVVPIVQSTEYFISTEVSPLPAQNATGMRTSDVIPAEPLDSPLKAARAESAKIFAQRRSRKQKTPEPALPRFYTPAPVRFFDPAAPGEVQDAPQPEEKIAATEAADVRPSNQLPPELKAAILQIDEQLRREKEKGSQRREKKEKATKEKKSKPPREEPATLVWEEIESAPVKRHVTPALPEPAIVAEEEVVAKAEEPVQAAMQAAPEFRESMLEAVSEAEPQVAAEPQIALEPQQIATPVSPAPTFYLTRLTEESNSSVLETLERAAPREVKGTPAAEQELIPASITPNAVWTEPSVEPASLNTSPAEQLPQKIMEPEKPIGEKALTKEKLPLGTRLQRWLEGNTTSRSGNRRRSERINLPGLVAFYWSGGAPKPHEIVNISKGGFYLRTRELWSPNTLVRMTLQKPHQTEEQTKESISVLARVVRIDDEGVGHEFVTTEALVGLRVRDIPPEHGTNRKELETFLRSR